MVMSWIDIETDADARRRSEGLWTPLWTENEDGSATGRVPGPEKTNGQFWGDAIKEASDPAIRLAIAQQHLPMPGAFSQMAVARRAIIRQLKKEGQAFNDELRQLHYWAAVSSWAVPYSEGLQEPGFNVLESTPYAKLAVLDFSYELIGCDQLLGLNKTDRKMMRDAWGEPKAHTTAHVLYGDLWREQESKLVEVRNKRRAMLMSEIAALSQPEPRKPGLLARLFKR